MAGFSGSNGGISPNAKKIDNYNSFLQEFENNLKVTFVDYFVNNKCNLACKHCYVGYNQAQNNLTHDKWVSVLNTLIKFGVRTFGNVGKEPLLSWDLTKYILNHLDFRRNSIGNIRFGLVTNGVLFNKDKINSLTQLNPDYIDISVDGDKIHHERIRGVNTYEPLLRNLELISTTNLKDNVWISFTLNRLNKDSIGWVINNLFNLGYRNFLISPYITLNENDNLYLSDEEIEAIIENVLNGNVINFDLYENLKLYIKHDYVTSGKIMFDLERKGIISKSNLFVDDYNIIFEKYNLRNNNCIYFNYIPFDISFRQIIRISHDGYISNCLDMFFQDYQNRTIGNINNNSIEDILSRAEIEMFDSK